MKKIITLLLIATLTMTVLVGCSTSSNKTAFSDDTVKGIYF